MKSYLFTTDTDRGGVMLCDIEDFDTAVSYLCNRFEGVVKIESAEQEWQLVASEQPGSAPVDSASGCIEPPTIEQSGVSAESDDLFA